MACYHREKTKYPGVFIVERNGKKSLYILYRREGTRKLIEEKLGSTSGGWTPARANSERARRIEGKSASNVEKRRQQTVALEAEANRWTFNRLLERYCQAKADLKGLEFDKLRYSNHLEKKFGDKEPRGLVSLDIERLRHRLRKDGMKPASVRHIVELLRRLANFGMKQGLCEGLKFQIQLPRVNNMKTETLTPEELKRLHEVLMEESNRGNPAAFMVRLTLATGMRRGELFRLQWRDIEDDHILLRETKGGIDARIPLNAAARRILDEVPRVLSEFIFPGRGGGQRNNAQKSLTRIKHLAGLPEDFRILHGSRHVYASTGVSNGIDLYTMQHLLTHKSPAMTQRYAHLANDHLRRASERTSALLAGEPGADVVNLEERRRA